MNPETDRVVPPHLLAVQNPVPYHEIMREARRLRAQTLADLCRRLWNALTPRADRPEGAGRRGYA